MKVIHLEAFESFSRAPELLWRQPPGDIPQPYAFSLWQIASDSKRPYEWWEDEKTLCVPMIQRISQGEDRVSSSVSKTAVAQWAQELEVHQKMSRRFEPQAEQQMMTRSQEKPDLPLHHTQDGSCLVGQTSRTEAQEAPMPW